MEVTRKNFEEVFPIIKKSVEEANFISVDSEFTGLTLTDAERPNLFDDGAERYRKLRKSVSQFSLSQIGLCTFKKREDKNMYEARSFNFYLFPKALGCMDRTFMCQSSCLEFLVAHNFDFNKFVYEGISYLNEEEEKDVNKLIESQDIFLGEDRRSDGEYLKNLCSEIAQWLTSAKDGDKFKVQDPQDMHTYMFQWEIRSLFHQVWTETACDGDFTVVKVTVERRLELETQSQQTEAQRVKNEMLGFTRVFRVIVDSKKLLLGHNSLTDLMLMYEKFYKPLPTSYKQYKQDIYTMFPSICDTKHLALNIKQSFAASELFHNTSLSALYKSLSSEKGRTYSLYSPDICHADGFHKYAQVHCPHEAGYDAFMCGYVFLRIAHLWATMGISSTDARPLSFQQYTSKLKPHLNNLNMIRGAVDNVCMDREDPVSRRPQWLYVTTRHTSNTIRSSQLLRLFSTYGCVDIKVKDSHTALVAVSNHACAKNILKAFHGNKTISVCRYSVWKHSPYIRTTMWAGVLLTGGICLWTLLFNVEVRPQSTS